MWRPVPVIPGLKGWNAKTGKLRQGNRYEVQEIPRLLSETLAQKKKKAVIQLKYYYSTVTNID